MRNALATAAIVALGLTTPVISQAQNYSQPSFNLPVPGFGNSNNREQQAQAPDRGRYCDDLRRRADDLRDRADHAQDRDDARRADDRLRDINDQLRRDCGRY